MIKIMAQISKNFKWWRLIEKLGAFFAFKNKLKGEFQMRLDMLVPVSFVVILFINQIIIILEKEKLEKKILIIFKMINGKPLTVKEKTYVRKYR